MRYLCARYGSAPFWPDLLEARTRIDQWAEWAKLNAAAKFTAPVFWRVVRTAPSQRDEAGLQAALAVLHQRLTIAEGQLADHAYLAGDAFSLADIQLGHLLYRYFDIAIERPDLPALRRYYDLLSDRPAFRKHVMISYDELRVENPAV